MVVEIRDWCQNVGEYNTYNFCIWHFGLCVIISKIDRCRSSDLPTHLVARRARSAISDCLVIHVFFPSFSLGPHQNPKRSGGHQLLVYNLWLPIINYTDTHLTCIFPKTNSFWAKSKHSLSQNNGDNTQKPITSWGFYSHTHKHTHTHLLSHT